MKKFLFKTIVFGIILLISLESVSIIFLHWFRSKGDACNLGFYELEENSLDVILVGSSHMYCGFNPAILRDEFGLDGYDLASPNQNSTVGYLYAKNAYRTQNYKVLVVDANSNYSVDNEDYFLFNNLRSISSMWPSLEYFEYIKYLDNKSSGLKFLFPVTIMHDKWKEEVPEMFLYENNNAESRGFCGIGSESKAGEEYSEPVIKYATDEIEDIPFTYFDLTKEFCDEHGIIMIVTKAVQVANDGNLWDDTRYNTIKNWCDNNDILYLDFNTPELIEAAGLVPTQDVAGDLRHANDIGAEKETRYLGKVISQMIK